MENYYQVLAINRTWSLNQIQSYLQSEQYVWDNLAQTRRDHQSILKSKLGRQAQKIFSTLASKEQYDKDLEAFLNPKAQTDPRQLRCEQLVKKAKDFLKNNELDLAEESISQALSYREEGNVEVLQLAAFIYDKLEKVSQALSCVNKAIVEKPDNLRTYHLKLSVLVTDYFVAHQQQFSSQEQRARTQNTLYNYLFGGFERDMHPTTDIQRLKVYDRIREKYRLIYQGFVRKEFEELCSRYRQLALRVGDVGFYDAAVVFDEFIDRPILLDTKTLDFCQKVMARSANSNRAKEFVKRYHATELEKQEVLASIVKLEKEREQILKEIEDSQKKMTELWNEKSNIKINYSDSDDRFGCVMIWLMFGVLFLAWGLITGDQFIFWKFSFLVLGIPSVAQLIISAQQNSKITKRDNIEAQYNELHKRNNDLNNRLPNLARMLNLEKQKLSSFG